MGHKTHLRRHISIFERLEIRLISKFWSIYLLLVPDPGEPNQCGSGSTRLVKTHQFQDERLKFVFIIFLFMSANGILTSIYGNC
jgi:hypothetical protein